MHTMHTFILIFPYPFVSKGFRGVEGMRRMMHTARIPMHTTRFFSRYRQKNGPVFFRYRENGPASGPVEGDRMRGRESAPLIGERQAAGHGAGPQGGKVEQVPVAGRMRVCVLSSCYRPVWREFSFRKSGRF